MDIKDHHDIFIKRLIEELEDQGITQAELARQIDRRRDVISKWKYDGTFPEAKTLIRICNALYVSSDYLLGLSDKR
jgi:transcriptional regulator with XRE-family HTH domain